MCKPAPLVTLVRAQLRHPVGIDTTFKSAVGNAKYFAPTKEMVYRHKGYEGYEPLDNREYTRLYLPILQAVPLDIWRWLYREGMAANDRLVLKCYCPEGVFCHTHLMIAYAVYQYPNAFVDGRNAYKCTNSENLLRSLI